MRRSGPRRSSCASPTAGSVTVLLNATPILSDDGAVESMIVTMQDMADVEEMERLRAEFSAWSATNCAHR